ncbi:MAG: preprotein translocase subunit SecE [Thermoleophilaceae bacterium]|nr:preprotein translocase subunit SecE [Thermoleophilaceae bacterium]
MARDRQQAKQRQAERRARRLAQERGDGAPQEENPAVSPELAAGAPPQDEGQSEALVFDEETDLGNEDEHLTEEEIEAEEEAEEELAARGEDGFEPRGRRGADPEAHKDRPRVVQFLVAVWAELQRVQWPDRQALTTLTGVVLGFVLIMGGYLGLLDAIFSEVIKAII